MHFAELYETDINKIAVGNGIGKKCLDIGFVWGSVEIQYDSDM